MWLKYIAPQTEFPHGVYQPGSAITLISALLGAFEWSLLLYVEHHGYKCIYGFKCINGYKCIYGFIVRFPQGSAGSGALPALQPGAAREFCWLRASGEAGFAISAIPFLPHAIGSTQCQLFPGDHIVMTSGFGSQGGERCPVPHGEEALKHGRQTHSVRKIS